MEPNYNNELLENKKSNTGLIVIIVILSIAVIGLSGYIIYDKVLNKPEVKEEEKVEKPNTEEPKEEEKQPVIEKPTLEKEEVLIKIYESLFYELNLNTEGRDLLTHESNRYHLVKNLIQQYKPEDVIYDSEIYNDVVGFFYIEETVFDNYYKEIIGKEFINSSTRVMTYDEIESYAKENDFEFNSNLINKDKKYYQITIMTGSPNYIDSIKIIENKIDENDNILITIEYSSQGILTRLHVTITNKVYSMTIEQ